MNKPRPKKELVITKTLSMPDNTTIAYIITTTPDADNWLRENASEFGDLMCFSNGHYHFYIQNSVYDPDDVLKYIEKMGVSTEQIISEIFYQ